MMKIKNKSKFIPAIIFFLLYFFASGEDMPWIEIIIGSVLFSALASLITLIIYKFFTLLFNSNRQENKEELIDLLEEVLDERDAKISHK